MGNLYYRSSKLSVASHNWGTLPDISEFLKNVSNFNLGPEPSEQDRSRYD